MIYAVLSVIDRAVAAYGRPIFAATVAQAVRSFTDEVNRPGSTDDLAKHPNDFDLVQLGVYDDATARFECLPDPRLICRAKDVAIRE